MNTHRNILILVAAFFMLTSCEHDIVTETTVYPDGALDKSIMLEFDSAKDVNRSIFHLSGWDSERVIKEYPKTADSAKSIKMFTRFTKKFESAEQANLVLAHPSDTLFQITSSFEKKFRWFYTYIRYAETFHALNRMNLKPDDYLTQEDYAFIDRLPAEGKKISKADNFYLEQLNNRIFDIYGTKAFYEEYFELTLRLLKKNNLESRWIDTLNVHKEDIFEVLENKKDVDDDFMLTVLDSLNIPINLDKSKNQYHEISKAFEAKVNFITTANDGKYINRINMPWTIFKTNADSTAGNTLMWAPPSIKFLLKDYTMYGECRKLNWWAVIVSVLFVGFTGYLFIRKSEIVIQFNDRKISIPKKNAS